MDINEITYPFVCRSAWEVFRLKLITLNKDSNSHVKRTIIKCEVEPIETVRIAPVNVIQRGRSLLPAQAEVHGDFDDILPTFVTIFFLEQIMI